MQPKQGMRYGDVIDTVEPKPINFRKFKDHKTWPIPRSPHFVPIMSRNRNWEAFLCKIECELDEVFMMTPAKRRYSQLDLALL